MRKFVTVLTGMVFLLGLTLSAGYGQYKQEKKKPEGIPSQDTIHLEKTSDKTTKQMQKDIDSIKSGQPAPESKAAVTAAPPAPAAAASASTQDTKKAKKDKKTKKAKKEKTN